LGATKAHVFREQHTSKPSKRFGPDNEGKKVSSWQDLPYLGLMKPMQSCVLGFAKSEVAKVKPETKSGVPAKTIVQPAKSPRPVGPYSHAVRVGNLLFCSGQIPIDPRTGNLVGDNIRAQTDRVLQNIRAILEHEKLGYDQVVKATVYLTSLEDFAGMNEIYGQYFARDYPARSTVQVAGLPCGAKVEIEVVAVCG
jgi:2-iminobutanoate/2-iminopropanoate deaminase